MSAAEERETKIRVSADRERSRIEETGARLELARTLERNWVLDTSDLTLRRSGRLLRIRHRGETWTLTLKDPGRLEGGHKIRPEAETGVQDGAALLSMLGSLGYGTVWRYEKYRTRYLLNQVKICLDETPMGDFLELEGPEGATEKVAEILGHEPSEFLDASYASLWFDHGGEGDLVFEEGTSP